MAQLIRRLRHWKQRFNKDAEFIFRRPMKFEGVNHQAGDPIPEVLFNNKTKLKRFWEAKAVELAEFEAPDVATGALPEPEVEQIDPPVSEEEPTDAEDEADDVSDADDAESTDDEPEPEADDEPEPEQEEDGEPEPEAEQEEETLYEHGEVYKLADRKWRVEGIDKNFTTRKAAQMNADKLLAPAKDDDDFLN